MKLLTTEEAGARLGVSAKRVRQLITENRLPAQRFGRMLLIDETDLRLVKDRKPGRPPSAKAKTGRRRLGRKLR